ncbi:pseudouridine-metabolizing bifunctional protein C1861.05-like [Manduca sexta]|uniref:pseudouridine-metabolizing bifunctional protein C1861.05-like n=1 Tax=Manduca sexta TaxID=7130 RepID=UPI00188E5872|nr:pseudouridine-metabolizing bifunctional protein C1861.05-like [Manduca sexta]
MCGVHRYGETTMDISADLTELSRNKTLVVCSGVKSILDIGRTLEYLETQGVCVCSFGESDDFPAFYTMKSGHRAPHRVPDALHAARLLHSSRLLQLGSGILVAVPLPQEHAMDEKIIEDAINCALEASREKGINGKEVTPFVLSAVASATHGVSLDANIALVKNNAKVGADIAVEFKKLNNKHMSDKKLNVTHTVIRREFHTSCHVRASEGCKGKDDVPLFTLDKHAKGDVLVIGGANVDQVYRLAEHKIQLDGSTHACATVQCGGGVGRNMAEALWRLQRGRTRLLTAVGDDVHGTYIANIAPGLLLDGCIVNGGRTPSYAAILDSKGECLLGLGDMELHNHITIDLVNKHIEVLKDAPLVVIDGNPPQETINHVLKLCHELQKPVFFEPTDRRKAIKAINEESTVTFTSPNLKELRAMAYYLEPHKKIKKTNDLNEISALSRIVSDYFKCLIVTMGSKGVVIVNNLTNDSENISFYQVNVLDNVENVSGAGDCFASGFINGILLGYTQSQCINLGLETAKQALLSKNTVPFDLHTIKLK